MRYSLNNLFTIIRLMRAETIAIAMVRATNIETLTVEISEVEFCNRELKKIVIIQQTQTVLTMSKLKKVDLGFNKSYFSRWCTLHVFFDKRDGLGYV